MKQQIIFEKGKVFLVLTDKKVNLKIELDSQSISDIYYHQDKEYAKEDFDTVFDSGGIGKRNNPKILDILKKEYLDNMVEDFHDHMSESDEWIWHLDETFNNFYDKVLLERFSVPKTITCK